MTWAIKLADERREGRKEGNISTLYGLYSDGDITLEKALVFRKSCSQTAEFCVAASV